MGIMAGAIESPPAADRTRTHPRLLCRGALRKKVRKLQNAVNSILAADAKEAARGESLNYTPYLFTDTPGSRLEGYLTKILAQTYVVMADRG